MVMTTISGVRVRLMGFWWLSPFACHGLYQVQDECERALPCYINLIHALLAEEIKEA